jgi:hypothetical protein
VLSSDNRSTIRKASFWEGLHIRLPRRITLEFDDFGSEQLAAMSRRYGLTLEQLLTCAARYTLLDSGRRGASRRAPRFRRLRAVDGNCSTLSLTVDVTPDDWNALAAEAEHQGERVERLMEHAVVHMLADLQAGRLHLQQLAARARS